MALGLWIWAAVARPLAVDLSTPFGDGGTGDHLFIRIEAGRLNLTRQHAYRVTSDTDQTNVIDSIGESDEWEYGLDATTYGRLNATELKGPSRVDGPSVPRGGGSVLITPNAGAPGFPWWISSNHTSTRMMLPGGAFAMTIGNWQIPLWMFILLGLLITAPALWLGRRSHRWRLAGHCLGCGYDLRQSPDRCPECGRPAPIAHPTG